MAALTAGPLPVEAFESLKRAAVASSVGSRSRLRLKNCSSRSLSAESAAAAAAGEGSAGRAMRLARLHTAVVMGAPESGAGVEEGRALRAMSPRLGDSHRELLREAGEPSRSPRSRLGLVIGRKWRGSGCSSAAADGSPMLGDWPPRRADGSLRRSDGLTVVSRRLVSMSTSGC